MKKPNFFIVGAPKCGTTALSEYLRDHPNIFMSWPKEPHYFAEDFDRFRRIKTYDDYIDIFHPAKEMHFAVGEASVWYLYSTVALRNIYNFNAKSKIIVMLRNPTDFVVSLHGQLVPTFFENEKEFETAWRLQVSRKVGKNIPSTCLEESFLQYAQAGRFAEQIERLLTVFPRGQVKIILFEDFIKNTRYVYEQTLAFLGLSPDGRKKFPKINARKEIKIALLGKMMYHPPDSVKWLEKKVKQVLKGIGIREVRLWHQIMDMNTKKISPKPLKPELHKELVDCFQEDIEMLSGLIGRDLNSWLSPLDEKSKVAS